MGDRATLQLDFTRIGHEHPQGIELYTHWKGHALPFLLQDALGSDQARGRWGDDSYLARILISQIIGEEWNQGLSWGLAPMDTGHENEYTDLTVHLPAGRVHVGLGSFSFEEYVALPKERLRRLWAGADDPGETETDAA